MDEFIVVLTTTGSEKEAAVIASALFGRFLYANMHHHVEHHLYPTVPFHALPKLNAEIAHHLPAPDRGVIRTNLEVLGAVVRRSLKRDRRLADA